jgi:hypothetical protein
MKKLLLTLALAASTVIAHGQGTIAFLNGPTTRHTLNGVSVPVGTPLVFGLFIGTSATSLSLTPAGPLAGLSTTAAGVMAGVPALYAIDGQAPGTVLFAKVRAWDASFGADWQTAFAQGRYRGETDVRELEPLGAASGPATVIWQGAAGVDPNRFYAMQIVPEPSVIALGVLGLGSLLFFRRRQAK